MTLVGAEVAGELKDGYIPAVDVVLQPPTNDPADFRPRARVHALSLSTLADPSDDNGRVLSIDGNPLGSPELADPQPRALKPPVIKAAEELLTQAGQGSSWWRSVR